MNTMDAANDKTIGRTNRSSPVRAVRPVTSAGESVTPPPPLTDTMSVNNNPLSAGEAPAAPTVETSSPPLLYTSTVGSASGGGGPFEWPTNADHYQLINRIGQGAFASVWRARIIRRTTNNNNDDDENNNEGADNKTTEIHCAIKIMDLEHVNINIQGESVLYNIMCGIEISFCLQNIIPWTH